MQTWPLEIWQNIIYFSEINECCKIAQTCKDLKFLCYESKIWEEKYWDLVNKTNIVVFSSVDKSYRTKLLLLMKHFYMMNTTRMPSLLFALKREKTLQKIKQALD
jgi:hypothetical protein